MAAPGRPPIRRYTIETEPICTLHAMYGITEIGDQSCSTRSKDSVSVFPIADEDKSETSNSVCVPLGTASGCWPIKDATRFSQFVYEVSPAEPVFAERSTLPPPDRPFISSICSFIDPAALEETTLIGTISSVPITFPLNSYR